MQGPEEPPPLCPALSTSPSAPRLPTRYPGVRVGRHKSAHKLTRIATPFGEPVCFRRMIILCCRSRAEQSGKHRRIAECCRCDSRPLLNAHFRRGWTTRTFGGANQYERIDAPATLPTRASAPRRECTTRLNAPGLPCERSEHQHYRKDIFVTGEGEKDALPALG